MNGGASQLLTVQSLTVARGISVYTECVQARCWDACLKVHYRGDNNWLAADSPNLNVTASGDFTIGVSPDPLEITAGSSGTATVTITPTGGFTGPITFTCPTGTNDVPVGYTCTLNPNPLTVTAAGAATSTMTLAPGTATAGAVHTALVLRPRGNLWRMELAAAIVLLSLTSGGAGGNRRAIGILLAASCALFVSGIVAGCGGGGGGGGGQVASTTTLTTSSGRVAFQTPVSFMVTVSASGSPGGTVQLYDNGQTYGNAATLNAGNVTFVTTNLPIGIHSISARYSGDAHTLPSTSAAISQMVLGNVPLQITAAANGGNAHSANFTLVLE